MDGENNGKSNYLMDDFGGTPIFGNINMLPELWPSGFLVILGGPMRTVQIGLAVNTYTSFEAQECDGRLVGGGFKEKWGMMMMMMMMMMMELFSRAMLVSGSVFCFEWVETTN